MIWAVQWLLANLFLPAVNLSLLLKMVNYLSKEEMLTKMAELLDVAVNWGLKRTGADQCGDGEKQFWSSDRDSSFDDWGRSDNSLWKSFSGLSFSGCDCTANF